MSDLSYLKLKWNIQGIFDDFSTIETELEHRIDKLPENKLNKRKKIANWISQINTIDHKIQNIKKFKLNEIEKQLNYTFAEPDLIVLSFIQPSIKNLFKELGTYSLKVDYRYNFESYLNLDEAAKVLALIGDAAIDLALVQILWQPNISSVGDLSIKRSDFASNENLARICDKWDLYDSRIHFDPNRSYIKKEKIDHVKGTIVEAIFGVMYIESGLDQIIPSIVALKKNPFFTPSNFHLARASVPICSAQLCGEGASLPSNSIVSMTAFNMLDYYYAPTNLSNSKTKNAGQTTALKNPNTPLQKPVAVEI